MRALYPAGIPMMLLGVLSGCATEGAKRGHLIVTFVAMLLASGCATSKVPPQPSDWPARPSETAGCVGVTGSYVDPNAVRDRTIYSQDEHGWSETGGTLDAAWFFFGFAAKDVSSFDKGIRGRGFTVKFNSENSLVIDYSVNGDIVASKEFLVSEYSCEQGVLKFATYRREGRNIYDKVPNVGSMKSDVEILRAADYLYVKYSSEANAFVYGFIPMSSSNVSWSRFPSVSTPRVPTLPPTRSFRWDISKKANLIEQEFAVTQHRFYQFDIEFHYNQLSDSLRRFIGTGQFSVTSGDMFFTKDPVHPIRVRPQDVGGDTQLIELYQKGNLIKKRLIPGVIIPVRIRVERIDEVSGNKTLMIDETINTEGMSHLGDGVRSRKIVSAHLKPGRYKVSANTLIDTPLPREPKVEIYTSLGIYYDSNVPPSND